MRPTSPIWPATRSGPRSRRAPTAYPGTIPDGVAFGQAHTRSYRWSRTFAAAELVDYLRTQSDHRMLAEDRREALLAAVGRVIEDHGGRYLQPYVCVLWAVERRSAPTGPPHLPRDWLHPSVSEQAGGADVHCFHHAPASHHALALGDPNTRIHEYTRMREYANTPANTRIREYARLGSPMLELRPAFRLAQASLGYSWDRSQGSPSRLRQRSANRVSLVRVQPLGPAAHEPAPVPCRDRCRPRSTRMCSAVPRWWSGASPRRF